MLLTVDVGNTKTASVAWSGSSPGGRRAVPTHEPRDWLAWAEEGGAPVDAIALASVVPAATTWWREVAAALGVELFVLDGRNAPGLTVSLDHPEGVGPDRIANALGALDQLALRKTGACLRQFAL